MLTQHHMVSFDTDTFIGTWRELCLFSLPFAKDHHCLAGSYFHPAEGRRLSGPGSLVAH